MSINIEKQIYIRNFLLFICKEKANEDIAAEVAEVTDLEKAAHSEPKKGWHSQAVVDLEFELTEETG